MYITLHKLEWENCASFFMFVVCRFCHNFHSLFKNKDYEIHYSSRGKLSQFATSLLHSCSANLNYKKKNSFGRLCSPMPFLHSGFFTRFFYILSKKSALREMKWGIIMSALAICSIHEEILRVVFIPPVWRSLAEFIVVSTYMIEISFTWNNLFLCDNILPLNIVNLWIK